MASSRLAGGLADDLVAQYGDHSAALVICAAGAGTLAVWNADLGRSNLPASPVFVPLVDELVDRLLGDRKRSSPVVSGEPMAVYLPPEVHTAAGLKIDAGSAADPPALGELVDEAQGVVWRMPSAVPPGIYRVERGGQTVFALASELAPEESDLRSLSPEVLRQIACRAAGKCNIEASMSATTSTICGPGWPWRQRWRCWSSCWFCESFAFEARRDDESPRFRTDDPDRAVAVAGRGGGRSVGVVCHRLRPAAGPAGSAGRIAVLMGIALALPLTILLNPTWHDRVPPPAGKPLLTVLVDSSASMATHDSPDAGTADAKVGDPARSRAAADSTRRGRIARGDCGTSRRPLRRATANLRHSSRRRSSRRSLPS